MGIPRLISTLEPYATLELLDNKAVVIDGPALAYHVLYICNRQGIVQPSYELLGSTAIAWLGELVGRGVKIDAIYFDGHLPLAKRLVRMSRISKSFHQLKLFHSQHQRACSQSYLSSTETTVPQLFTSDQPLGKPFLPPSFHVPAIIDALRASPYYKPLVRLVPGEADVYCAHNLDRARGVVLTSDSDLLVHDLGDGSVVFFRDIHLDGYSRLACATFCPGKICNRLGLPLSADMCRLAYELKCSPHHTLPQLLQTCSKSIVDATDYREFCQEYLHHEVASLPLSAAGHNLAIEALDPRISELVLQFGHYQGGDTEHSHELKMFLPILVEDPVRGSAWEQSTPIRQLAYSIAGWLIPGRTSSVQEYRRVNSPTQKGREVTFVDKAAARAYVDEIIRLMALAKGEAKADDTLCWLLLCLSLDIKECQQQDKKSHILHHLQRFAASTPDESGKVSWDTVHFVAQLQASYYSFRILKQVLSADPDNTNVDVVPELGKLLSSFPPLFQYPNIDSTMSFLHTIVELGTLDKIARLVQIPKQPQLQARQTKTARKRKNTKENAEAKKIKASLENPMTRNLFNILTED
ncbi:hypothetical protein G7046_g3915 [Stylonectria norvegica]|nr:hypothetical protein G7046_g3915 [Stylonectria norvegica]